MVRSTVGYSGSALSPVYALVAEDFSIEEVITPHSFHQAANHPDRVYKDQVIEKHIITDDPIPVLHVLSRDLSSTDACQLRTTVFYDRSVALTKQH